MRQQLWELNSALLGVLLTIILCSYFFLKKHIPPAKRITSSAREELEEKEESRINPEIIFMNDLFDTYRAPIAEEAAVSPLVPTIPQPKLPKPHFRPIEKKIEPLPPLNIALHGILSSSHKENNVALIEDETLLEQSYYVGDSIKDGQIIQILKESVTVVRANGQYETLYLKRDELFSKDEQPPVDTIVKKSEDGSTILVDPQNLKCKIRSLTQVVDELALATAYQKGKPVGVQIGSFPQDSLYPLFEIKSGDILTSLNSMSLATAQSRYEAYQSITQITYGSQVTLKLLRKNQPITLSYTLTRMQPSSIFGAQPPAFNGKFSLSKQQQRAENTRQFAKEHDRDRDSTLELLRQRLLENIKNREPNMRSR